MNKSEIEQFQSLKSGWLILGHGIRQSFKRSSPASLRSGSRSRLRYLVANSTLMALGMISSAVKAGWRPAVLWVRPQFPRC